MCIILDLIFRNCISVCPVYGESEIVQGQGGLNKKKHKDITDCIIYNRFLKSEKIH